MPGRWSEDATGEGGESPAVAIAVMVAAGRTSGQGARARRLRRPRRRRRRRRLPARRSTTPSRRSTRSPRAAEHVGAARRVPVRLEAHDGRLHPAGPRRVPRQGRRAASQGRLDDPAEPGRRRALRRRRGPRRRADVAAVPPDEGRDHRADRARPSREPTSSSSSARAARTSSRPRSSASRSPTAEIADVDLGDEVLVGLALCSHNPDVTERAIFRDVRIIRPAKDSSCRIATSSAACSRSSTSQTGHRQIVHRSEQPFEAPTGRGRQRADLQHAAGAGRLGRAVSLRPRDAAVHAHRHRRRQPQQQRPRALVRRHDARHQRSEPGVGRPLDGLHACRSAAARRSGSRTLSPSYLHSWSPDGKALIFTGGRNNEFDIYRIPADGSGPEVKLTDFKGLDDGPEYTPDGKYIYFNSVAERARCRSGG